MSPVFPVFHTVTTVSWSQIRLQNDNVFLPLNHIDFKHYVMRLLSGQADAAVKQGQTLF